MKLRLPIVLLPPRGSWLLPPPRGSRARLPFVLVAVLAGLAALQLASPERIELPPGGAVARVGPVAPTQAPPPVIAPPLLARRDLFAPPDAKPEGIAITGDPLDGAVIEGVVQQGRLRLGIVRLANGMLRHVAVGGAIAGWRLASLDQAEARLTLARGPNLLVPYGTHASLPQSSGTTSTESGQ